MQQTTDLPLPFQHLEDNLQKKIDTQAQIVTLKKGDTTYLADKVNKYVYVVKGGKVKSYQLNLQKGKEQTLYIYSNNHIFDTITILDGEEHDVCYEVLEDTTLIMYPIEFVRNLLHNFPEFSQKFYLYIAKQMRYLEETITDISLYSTSERLIKLIVQDFTPNNIFRFNILKGLSHTETANLLGTVRHVVERHLRNLKKENMINVVDRRIQILNAEKLLKKINFLT